MEPLTTYIIRFITFIWARWVMIPPLSARWT